MRALTWQGKRQGQRRGGSRTRVIQEPRTRSSGSRRRRSAARTCTCTSSSGRSSKPATSSGTSRWASSRRSASRSRNLAVGDRVVIPFNIACGDCFMCRRGLQSQCETTQVRDYRQRGEPLRIHRALRLRCPADRPNTCASVARLRAYQGRHRAARTIATCSSATSCPLPGRASSTRTCPTAARWPCSGLGPVGQFARAIGRAPRIPGVRSRSRSGAPQRWRSGTASRL